MGVEEDDGSLRSMARDEQRYACIMTLDKLN